MKVCFERVLTVQDINVKHSETTGKDYYSVSCLDSSNGEFIKLPITENTAKLLEKGKSYTFFVRCESFYNEEAHISAFKLFAYSFK